MDLFLQVLYFIAYPLNWILFDLKLLIDSFIPMGYGGMISHYIVFSTLIVFTYVRIIGDSRFIETYFGHLGLHIISVMIVSLSGLFTGFNPSFQISNTPDNIALINLGLYAFSYLMIRKYYYDISVVQRGMIAGKENAFK